MVAGSPRSQAYKPTNPGFIFVTRRGPETLKSGLFQMTRAAGSFLFRVVRFIGQHPILRAFGELPFGPADFFDASDFRVQPAFATRLDFVEQQTAGDEAIQTLLARGLTFDLHAAGTMQQHHAGRGLVDVLPAVAAGA